MYKKIILEVMEIESGRKLLNQHVNPRDRNGGYTNDPDDFGGRTNWGITQPTLNRLWAGKDVETLTFLEAYDFYQEHYYTPSGAGLAATYSRPIESLLFEYGIHRGPEMAVKALQEQLNVNNNNGSLWADLALDGLLGPATEGATLAFAKHRQHQDGELSMYLQLGAEMLNYYKERVMEVPSQERYYYGWSRRIVRKHREHLALIK